VETRVRTRWDYQQKHAARSAAKLPLHRETTTTDAGQSNSLIGT
jgi:hypothetical protein